MLGSSILFLPFPPFPDGRKVSQTPESTVWRSVWAAGAHTEQEEEEVGGGGGTAGEKVSLGALDGSESSQPGYSHKGAGI